MIFVSSYDYIIDCVTLTWPMDLDASLCCDERLGPFGLGFIGNRKNTKACILIKY